MEQFLQQYGYIALLIGTFLEGEVAILVASTLVNQGIFEMPYALGFAFTGSFISDWLYFLIGRLNGKYFIDQRPALKARVEPVTNFFNRNQLPFLLSYRFLYGFRVIIPLVIGMSGLPPIRFLPFSILAGLFWVTVVGTIGYWVGHVLQLNVRSFEDNIVFVVLGFAAFGVAFGLLIKNVIASRLSP